MPILRHWPRARRRQGAEEPPGEMSPRAETVRRHQSLSARANRVSRAERRRVRVTRRRRYGMARAVRTRTAHSGTGVSGTGLRLRNRTR